MSYNKGQSQFGSLRGNMWAMVRQLLEAQGSVNASDQLGSGGLQAIKATYDFSLDGGAIGTFQLVNSQIIPANFIILGGILFPITTFTSGGGATMAVGIGSGAQTAAIKAATGFATFVGGTPLVMIPQWASGFFAVAADGKVSVTIAGGTITGGKMAIHLVGVAGGE